MDFGWKQFLVDKGVSADMFERVANASVKDPAWNEIDRGIMTRREVLDCFVKNDPEIEPLLVKCFSNIHGMLTQFSYTKDWIKQLQSEGFKVYCLSNMSHFACDECADALDFIPLLDGAVLSCNIHMIKPDKEIYEYLFKTYDLVPGECVFLDDLPANIEKAKSLGMKGIVFTDKESAQAKLHALCKED